ncbi:hypothetical protein [Amycolatopsis deserti]|nr:hypothetical protein [Amycolatopsis deserti]
MALSPEDPGAILDRYFVPDFVYCNDGIEIDRQRMEAEIHTFGQLAADGRIQRIDQLSRQHPSAHPHGR